MDNNDWMEAAASEQALEKPRKLRESDKDKIRAVDAFTPYDAVKVFHPDPPRVTIPHPTFAITPEDRAREQIREEKDRLDYMESQVLQGLKTVVQEKQRQLSECRSQGNNICAIHTRDLGECTREWRRANRQLTGTLILGTIGEQVAVDMLNALKGKDYAVRGEIRRKKV